MTDVHPEFEEEQHFLHRTVDAIDRALEQLRGRYYEAGANNYTNRVLNTTIRADTLEQLEDYNHRPYFGRLDFEGQRGGETVYFGFAHLPLPHGKILDWRCDLYSLYVGTNAREQRYRVKATGREHRVDLLLKRRFEMEGRHLQAITDQVDRRRVVQAAQPSVDPPVSNPVVPPPPTEDLPPAVVDVSPAPAPCEPEVRDDAFLIRQLYSRGDPRLQDIVETIQAQQDEIIRLPLDQLLVLHGVAGSGKTSIAYHRLAYLMYPEHGYDLRPNQVLVVGPNRTFLTYVRDLLPSLGVTNIAQRTFQDWAWGRMRLRNKALPARVDFRDAVEALLEEPGVSREVRDAARTTARLKGTPRFRQLVERYAQRLLNTPLLPAETLTIPGKLEGRSLNIPLTVPEVQAMWEEVRGEGTLDEQRERFLRRAARHPGTWFTAVFGEPTPRDRGFVLQMSKAVRERLGRVWPRPNLLRLYDVMFLGDTLRALGSDLFTEQELALLTREPPPKPVRETKAEASEGSEGVEDEPVEVSERPSVDLVDVAGLLLLNDALYGNQSSRYRHVVLDEAQDFSPLQVQLLLEACPSASMTVVGDTAQGIYAYRGIDDWDDLGDVLPGKQVRRELITQNYRSTREIVAFTNAVQQAVRGERALPSVAINRTGPMPRVAAFDTSAQFQQALVTTLGEVQAAGFRGIAVVTPDEQAAFAIQNLLREHYILHQAVSARTETTPAQLAGTVVIPAALTKGLEFEAVILADASEAAYPEDDPHAGRLLYVAVSRALHMLQVLSSGPWTPWLSGAVPHAEVTATARLVPARSKLERVRQTLRRSLSDGVTLLRAERLPLRVLVGDLGEVAERLLTEGRVTEVLDAYLRVGQFAPYSVNELLYRLSETGEHETFLRYTLACGAPAWLDEEVDQALTHLAQAGNDAGETLAREFERVRGGSPSPVPLPHS